MNEITTKETSEIAERLKKRASEIVERPLEEVLVVLVDTSSSMGETVESGYSKLQVVHKAVPLLEGRGHYLEYGLIGFGSQATQIQPFTQSFSSLIFQVEFMQPTGMTAMVPAISLGVDMICSKIQLRPNQPDLKKRMVLLTDGHGNIDDSRLMMVVQKCKEVGVVVDTIGFGRDADEQTLQMISRETGGKYQKADSPLELEAAYQKLNYNQRYLTHNGG